MSTKNRKTKMRTLFTLLEKMFAPSLLNEVVQDTAMLQATFPKQWSGCNVTVEHILYCLLLRPSDFSSECYSKSYFSTSLEKMRR